MGIPKLLQFSMDVGTEMGSILDVRVTRSNGELKGDHVAGPKLVLRLCAIPVNKDDSKLPIKVLVPLLWIVFTAFVSYTMFKLFTGKYVGSIIIGNHLWVLHATLIYTLVARSMLFSNSRILDVMTYCVESGNSAERLSYSNRSIDYMLQKLKHYSWCTSYFVFFGVTLNLCAAGSAIFLGNLYYMLPLSKSIWYLICGIAVWYFYSFGWFLSVLFSGVPSYMLTERVIELVMFVETLNGRCNCDHAKLNCVEEQVPLAAKVDFNVINNWYDDLYAINKILNGCVSGLITATVGICGPLNVFLLSVSMTLYLCTKLCLIVDCYAIAIDGYWFGWRV